MIAADAVQALFVGSIVAIAGGLSWLVLVLPGMRPVDRVASIAGLLLICGLAVATVFDWPPS